VNTALTDRRDALRRAVTRDYVELRRAVRQLQTAVRDSADVPEHIARRPYAWIGGAFLLGLMLGARAGASHG